MDLNSFRTNLEKCITHLNEDLAGIHSGRSSTELVEGFKVEAYGTQMELKGVANISVSDARSILITPWDKTLSESIAKSISGSNLGFLASVEADSVRVKIPDLTEERRKEFVKVMKEKVEGARIAVRNVRQEIMKEIDVAVEGGLSEDEGKRFRDDVEKAVKESNEKIEQMRESKEKDLMTI